MRALGLLTCVAVTGCTFSSPPGTNPDGTVPIDQVPPDAAVCFGSGLGKLCLKQPPIQPRSLTGTLDTTIDTICTEIISVAGTEACVVAATSIDLAVNATVRTVGTRPLVLVAAGIFQIQGVLDAGSQRGMRSGPGAPDTTCQDLGPAQNDDGGGGGGAGGSFIGAGGDGGIGDTNNNGQPAGTAQGGLHVLGGLPPTTLRGGCRGGNGGSGGAGSNAGVGGRGGGAIYLISGTEILISGRVVAYGAGGGGGNLQGGGGGGGSGGMIGLDAPAIIVSGILAANGGGGGEGGGVGGGVSGNDGSVDGSRAEGGFAQAGDGGNDDGGNGGQGSGGDPLTGARGGDDAGGGGGGGGGAGFIYVKGRIELSGIASPPTFVAP